MIDIQSFNKSLKATSIKNTWIKKTKLNGNIVFISSLKDTEELIVFGGKLNNKDTVKNLKLKSCFRQTRWCQYGRKLISRNI